jgi:hypothetical protein
MTFDEAKARYIDALRQIIVDDPIVARLIASHNDAPIRIRNSAIGEDARRAVDALTSMRAALRV